MATTRKRPNMNERLDGAAPASVTPISRGRDVFTAAAAPSGGGEGTPLQVAVASIDPSPDNPRSQLGDLTELAASIRELGVLQPLMVRANGDRYDLVYGHRRLAAAREAGHDTVPVLVSTDDDVSRDHARRLVENLHREDLTALDEARAYQALLALVTGGQRAVARMVGTSQANVSKRLALLRLPADVQTEVDSGRITVSDAAELLKLADDPAALKKAVKQGSRNSYAGAIGDAVKRELLDLERNQARAALAEELRGQGLTVLENEGRGRYCRDDGPYPVTHLPVDADEHVTLACHAVFLPTYSHTEAVPVCLDPQSHLAGDREATAESEARDQAEREARDDARLAAAQARHDLACRLVRKGSPDAGAGVLMTEILTGGWFKLDDDGVAELLGLAADTFNGATPGDAIAAYTAKGTRNAQRAIYATALAIGEGSIGTQRWDDRTARLRPYLEHLVANGHQLSEYEQELLVDEDEDESDGDT